LAIDDKASIFCAREMRGTMSIATAVAPRALTTSSKSGFWAGQKKLIRVWPLRNASASGTSGPRTLTSTSAAATTAAALGSTCTPAAA
jgi:hypothetical protein